MTATYRAILDQVGITFFVLFPMSLIGLSLMFTLMYLSAQKELPSPWMVRTLQYIQGTACEIGLLGSVLALSTSFGRLGPDISKEIVSSMLYLLSHAFGSTIYGVVLYLVSSAGLFFCEENDAKH